MIRDSYSDKLLRSASTFFGRWTGAHARLISLTDSHRTLVILLMRPGLPGNLVIACIEPIFIHAPCDWDDCSLSLAARESTDPTETIFVLADAGADMEIVCGAVEIAENVERYESKNPDTSPR